MTLRAASLVFLVLALVACDGAAGSSDGGAGADSASLADGSTPTDAGPLVGLEGFCTAAAARVSACAGSLGTCEREELAQCAETFDIERQEIIDARASRGFPAACDASSFETRRCVYDATVDVMPTAAQMSLADAICGACGPAGATPCHENFFYRAPPMEGSTGVSGTGASFFNFTDEFVAELAGDCVPPMGAASCRPMFYDCIARHVSAARPASVTAACMPVGPGT